VFFHDRDGDIEGKVRDRDARLRVDVPLSLARARLDAARRVIDHRGLCRVTSARRRACHARVVLCACCARDLMRFEKRGRRCSFSTFRGTVEEPLGVLFTSTRVGEGRALVAAVDPAGSVSSSCIDASNVRVAAVVPAGSVSSSCLDASNVRVASQGARAARAAALHGFLQAPSRMPPAR
jgi:hypothetical protein